ncbi:MAG TPA: hypothetical protein P5149_11100, partial [Candidatus Competibacteraceae bacterium]|nr:hypothetical protein [Candidatus Competibacteraceae bacterium]HRY18937.1 hypothetical protein [Candidatus Competibacteraceae bacterium]
MKVLLTLASAALLMNISLHPAGSPRLTLFGGATAHARVSVDFGFFYNELAPYGEWRSLDPYGWVWYPDVAADWQPYTLGHWVFTDEFGWTWVSTEPWGSIPFHYGRWFYDDNYGRWAWVPDTEWGPAWVSWRSGSGFIGWAPLPPTVRFKPNIRFFSPRQDAGIRRKDWCFVSTSQFLNPRLQQVIVPPRRNINLIKNTTNVTRYLVINQRVVNRSIDFDHFERETRTRVPRYRVVETDQPMMRETPVREGQVILFRPQIVRTNTPPPPGAIRTPDRRAGSRHPDYYSERQTPDVAPRSYRRRDDQDWQDWQDDRQPPDTDRRFSNNPRSPEFEERDEQRLRVEQEQTRQRTEREQQRQQRQQQREQEQARQRAER